jgi:hypothetical protein
MGPISKVTLVYLTTVQKKTPLYLLYNEQDLEYCKHQKARVHAHTQKCYSKENDIVLFNSDQSTESTG